jgi:hypothetical protein
VGVIAFLALLFCFGSLFIRGSRAATWGMIVYALVWGFVGVVTLLAIAELIKLLIDVEENTSRQNELMEKLIDKMK